MRLTHLGVHFVPVVVLLPNDGSYSGLEYTILVGKVRHGPALLVEAVKLFLGHRRHAALEFRFSFFNVIEPSLLAEAFILELLVLKHGVSDSLCHFSWFPIFDGTDGVCVGFPELLLLFCEVFCLESLGDKD